LSVAVSASSSASAVRAAEAAALLYEHHSARIFSFCVRRLRSREEAEDALQQTFLKAFAAMRGGFRPSVERAWLYRIAENVCADRLRANGRRVRHETRDADGVLEVLPAKEAQPIEGLDRALAALTPQQRQALLLREWQGLSYDEIASELRLSHSAVETLLFRARRALARKLEAIPMIPWLKASLFGGGAGAKAVATVAVTVSVGVGAATVAPTVVDRAPSERAPVPNRTYDTTVVAPERTAEARTKPAITPVRRAAKRRAAPSGSAGAAVGTAVDTAPRERPPVVSAGAAEATAAEAAPTRSAPPVDQAPAATVPAVPAATVPTPPVAPPPAPELTTPIGPTLPAAPVELPSLTEPKVELPSVELAPPLEPVQLVVDAAPELPLLP
jgi:RNA polymerase sigma-70 factor, ECF subfamily